MVTTTSFYGVDVTGQAAPGPASTDEILEVFEILKPKPSKTPLIRIGRDIDGSYLVPDDLDGITACFSPGVNRIKYFEDFLTDNYGIECHMMDFSCDVDEFKTPLRPGKQTFAKKWLDVAPGQDNVSLEDWVAEHGVAGDLLLQIDIEGAEYRNLLATSDETLARFRVIVIEVHSLGRMLDEAVLRGALAPFFKKLARTFTTVHAHPNNCCGEFVVPGTDIRIPEVLELTLLRTDRFVPGTGSPLLPHPLDVSRNVAQVPPLFLSDAWCDYQRPLESRVKMLEDMQRFRDEVAVASTASSDELIGALSLTMQSLQTLNRLAAPKPAPEGNLVEVAGGRPYRLSSAYAGASRKGIVAPNGDYFFHTGFGPGQSIRVDLGRARRIRRIEVTNRRDMGQDRANHIFVELTGPKGVKTVFPMYKRGKLPGGAWQECIIDIPDVDARFVKIVNPLDTALHFADLRVYAVDEGHSRTPPSTRLANWSPSRLARAARRRLEPLARPAASAAAAPAAPPSRREPAPKPAPLSPALNIIDGCAKYGVPLTRIRE